MEMNELKISKFLEIIGKNIDRLRGGMSRGKLAKKVGVSRGTIESAIKGKAINFKNLIKIADALGVSPADLFISDFDRGEVSYKHKLLMDLIFKKEGGIK
jgi:transcriptional regulator with XRE-family HTH domain